MPTVMDVASMEADGDVEDGALTFALNEVGKAAQWSRSWLRTMDNLTDISDRAYAPACIASTDSSFDIIKSPKNHFPRDRHDVKPPKVAESNCFRDAQWSNDGTTIVTHNEDWQLRSFVL